MAASVINSPRAIEASIFVVRAFVRLRKMVETHTELLQKVGELEHRLGGCPRIGLYVISTKGRNLKPRYFQCNKISRSARNDNFGAFSDSLLESHDEQIQAIFEAIRALMAPPAKPRKKIGFVVKEKKAAYGKRTKGSRKNNIQSR
jgi:hypothetical protein